MVFERKIWRKIFDPTYENGSWLIKTTQKLNKLIKHKNIINFVKAQRLEWHDHIKRNKNGQSNTLLVIHFKEAKGKNKATLGG